MELINKKINHLVGRKTYDSASNALDPYITANIGSKVSKELYPEPPAFSMESRFPSKIELIYEPVTDVLEKLYGVIKEYTF